MTKIEIFSDVVCPWCYIGKRNLEKALQILNEKDKEFEYTLNWRSFQLNPQLKNEGILRKDYITNKFGEGANSEIIYERVRLAGEAVGLTMSFDKIIMQPNSSKMHSLIYAAKETNKDIELIENFFKAFFIDGMNLTDFEIVSKVALDSGLDSETINAVFHENLFEKFVQEDIIMSKKYNITGVPFYVIDDSVGISGAQPPEVIVDAINQSKNNN
jgi:predicted DsbA family dithiol-disulfide isomerase